MDLTFTKAEILAAMKAWYKNIPDYTDEDAGDAVDWIVQIIEDARKKPDPL